jgi:hypothetical protein
MPTRRQCSSFLNFSPSFPRPRDRSQSSPLYSAWAKGSANRRELSQICEWGRRSRIDLLAEMILRSEGRKSGWGSNGGAKNEALFPGRVPHVRPSVHGPKKTGRSPSQRFCNVAKRLWPRAREIRVYAQANMGHPSRTIDRGSEIKFARLASPSLQRYSDLRACAGSSREARHAGAMQASMATNNRATTTQPNTVGSSGRVS